jgi:hypothetical protein
LSSERLIKAATNRDNKSDANHIPFPSEGYHRMLASDQARAERGLQILADEARESRGTSIMHSDPSGQAALICPL